MGWMDLPGFRGLFNPANAFGMLVGVKLLRLLSGSWPCHLCFARGVS
jgi:hypothetical protein